MGNINPSKATGDGWPWWPWPYSKQRSWPSAGQLSIRCLVIRLPYDDVLLDVAGVMCSLNERQSQVLVSIQQRHYNISLLLLGLRVVNVCNNNVPPVNIVNGRTHGPSLSAHHCHWLWVMLISFIKIHLCIPEVSKKMLPKVFIWQYVILLWPWPLMF